MIDHKLIAMKQKAHVTLRSYEFQSDWTCEVESRGGTAQFKIEVTGPTPVDAVNAAHERWLRITDAVPEFIGALPPPDEHQDGDQFIEHPTTSVIRSLDDIPF